MDKLAAHATVEIPLKFTSTLTTWDSFTVHASSTSLTTSKDLSKQLIPAKNVGDQSLKKARTARTLASLSLLLEDITSLTITALLEKQP
jgi:hypothetical protein